MIVDPKSLTTVLALMLLAGCDSVGPMLQHHRGDGTPNADDAANTDGGAGDPGPICASSLGRSYLGFGGEKLEEHGLDQVDRVDAHAGTDRVRVKPFTVVNATKDKDYTMYSFTMFAGELVRVLGLTGNDVNSIGADRVGSAFGVLPDRWYVEPRAGAVPLYSMYVTAFKACGKYVRLPANTRYESLATDARTECASMQRGFWNRAPTQEETDACVSVATDASLDVGSNTEKDNALSRWTFTCAAVLTAEAFVTY